MRPSNDMLGAVLSTLMRPFESMLGQAMGCLSLVVAVNVGLALLIVHWKIAICIAVFYVGALLLKRWYDRRRQAEW